MVEPRIASKHTTVYAFPTNAYLDWAAWEKTLGDDDDPKYEVSPCGGSISVKPTVVSAASLCVWSILDWVKESAYDFGKNAFMSPPQIGYCNNDPFTA